MMINLDDNSKVIFDSYITKQPNYVHNLMRGIEILKALQTYSCDSYIIGPAVRDLVLGNPIKEVVIYTSGSYPELSKICPTIKHDSKSYFFTEADCEFIFYQLKDGKTKLDCFDKRLAYVVDQIPFAFESLILSQSQIINDLVSGYKDLQNHVIRTNKKPRHVIRQNPKVILDAILAMGKYRFTLNKKLRRAILFNKKLLSKLSDETIVNFIYDLFQSPDYKYALNFIVDNHLFKYHHIYDEYFKKISDNPKLPFEQKMLMIYLYLNNIPNRNNLLPGQIEDFEEKIVITNYLLNSKITNMLVYNIGEKTLCVCDEIACLYNKKYHSQKKTIAKIKKNIKINNIRDLKISNLEIINLLNGERGLKNKIIHNMLLARVINDEVKNENLALKAEVMKVNQEIKDIFYYQEPVVEINYTPEVLNNLLNKYKKEHKLLVDIYLHDEKELYNLSVNERQEKIAEAKAHAKEFLLQTNQYKILEERKMI